MTVKLISFTPDAEKHIAYCARVSNPNNQQSDKFEGLIKYCIKNRHWSIFEQAFMTLEIETSRAIAAQILRHRSFTFQEFCMAGDSEVYFDLPSGIKNKKRALYKVTLEKLYKNWCRGEKVQNKIKNMNVRVFDEKTKTFTNSNIKEVFQTGLKDIYEITLENGKKIRCTKEHKVLTKNGFKSLEESSGLKKIGNTAVIDNNIFIGCNGVPVYQDYEWMASAKEKSILDSTGLAGIAEEAGISYHTVRKWLKRHNLSCTEKGVSPKNKITVSNERKSNILTVSWSKIKTVKYLGQQMTYDLEINHDSHNYVANGVVVHNSQRYSDTNLISKHIPIPELRRQDLKNRQNSTDDLEGFLKLTLECEIAEHFNASMKLYNRLLEHGVAKESARFVLPLATPTRMYMTGSIRSWITYISLREKNGTQKEHMLIAKDCKKILCEQFPVIAEALGGLETEWEI